MSYFRIPKSGSVIAMSSLILAMSSAGCSGLITKAYTLQLTSGGHCDIFYTEPTLFADISGAICYDKAGRMLSSFDGQAGTPLGLLLGSPVNAAVAGTAAAAY